MGARLCTLKFILKYLKSPLRNKSILRQDPFVLEFVTKKSPEIHFVKNKLLCSRLRRGLPYMYRMHFMS